MCSLFFLLLFVFFSTTLACILDSDIFPDCFTLQIPPDTDLFPDRLTWLIHTGHRFLPQIYNLGEHPSMSSDDLARPSTSRDADEPAASTSRDADEPAASTSREIFEDAPISKRRMYTSEVKSLYNLPRLVRELCTREQGIAFAEEQGLILRSKQCRIHRTAMNVVYSHNKTVGSFICSKGTCRTRSRVSRSDGTWFENVKISLPRIYYLMYAFAHRWPHTLTIREDMSSDEQCLSSATISDWYSYCRETIVIFQLEKQEHKGKIGGPGKIVQIDESKFGKRKYNRGRHVEGHWVLGMIEDGSEDLRLEICPDNTRTSEVLVPLIQKHVEVGTTIHTDFWRAYDCLADHGYIHKKVNHSDDINPFVADDGTHTQRIESQWRVVKRFFYKDNYNHPENFADVIVEYMWRRSVEKQKKDPFIELIKAIKYVYDPEKT